jgi:twinkle protein
MLGLASVGQNIFIASMEMKPEAVFARLVAAFFNAKQPTAAQINEFFDFIGPRFFFCDRVGYVERPALLEMMRFAFCRYGVTQFLIDSLMRIQGLEEDYVAQGDFMNELASFAKTTGVHIHLVCHPRKLAEGSTPGKMDIKGSSLIINNCDNAISVSRNPEKDRIRKERQLTPAEEAAYSDTIIRVEKQRETGWEGKFELVFDRANYAFGKFKRPSTTLN